METLIAEVSRDEESINENTNEEQFSSHKTSSEEKFDLDNLLDADYLSEIFFGKTGKTKWNKQKPRQNMKTLPHNTLTKLPGNAEVAKIEFSPIDFWVSLNDNTYYQMFLVAQILILKKNYNFQRDRDSRPHSLIQINALIGLLCF